MSINAAIDVGKFEHLGAFLYKKNITTEEKEKFFEIFCNAVIKSEDHKGIIGFEAPLFIPAYSIKEIGVIRSGNDQEEEGNCDIDRRSCVWHSPVGAGVTIRGIVLLQLFFAQIARTPSLKDFTIYTDYLEFKNAPSGILVYEAFINGEGDNNNAHEIPQKYLCKDNDHNQDAALSAFFFDQLAQPDQSKEIKNIHTPPYINLPAVLASNIGLKVAGTNSGFVIRALKPNHGCYYGNADYFNVSWDKMH